MFNKVKHLDKEYYALLMKEPENPLTLGKLKASFWALWYFACIFGVFLPWIIIAGDSLSEEPFYLYATTIAVTVLATCYLLYILAISFGKSLKNHYGLQQWARFFGGVLAQVGLWNLCLLVFTGVSEGSFEYFIYSLLVLIIGAIIDIFVIHRTIKQISVGAYRQDGGGFFGILNRPKGKKLAEVLKIVVPPIGSFIMGMAILWYAMGRANSLTQKLVPISGAQPSSFVNTVVGPIVLVILEVALMCAFSILIKNPLMRLHLKRKFNYRVPLADKPMKPKRQRQSS